MAGAGLPGLIFSSRGCSITISVSSVFQMKRQGILLIFRRAFDMAPSFEIFWTALSERRGELELGRGRSQRQDSFGHEPALVARCRSPAKLLLGFPKFVGIPRCSDHRRCHPCCWHSQGGPAALASCRTSEQLRRLEGSCQPQLPLPRIDVRFSPSFLTIRHA